MIALSRKADYALAALSYLAAERGRVASARTIGDALGLPVPLLMNLLKTLHHVGLVEATRGSRGGYALSPQAGERSLAYLIEAIDGPVKLTDCVVDDGCEQDHCCRLDEDCPVQAPLLALHHRLKSFLNDVKLWDIIGKGSGIVGGLRD